MKVLAFFVECIYWFGIFLSPAGIVGGAGVLVYYNYPTTWGLILMIALGVIGVTLGIVLAEYARRTVGCSVFWSRISSPAGNPNQGQS